MKTLRLSLSLNELEMAERLGVAIDQYNSFEESPLVLGGSLLEKYLVLLDEVDEVSNLSNMFLEFAKFDLKTERGAVNIFERYPLRLIEGEQDKTLIE